MNTSSSSLPPDISCVICSKPIRSGGYIQFETGDFLHIRCRSRQLQLTVLDHRDRTRLAVELAKNLVHENARLRGRPPTRLIARRNPCPVCGVTATLTDWRPHIEWMAIEGCPCSGFFVWTPLLEAGRLARLTVEDRDALSQGLRQLRATGSEAWLSARYGTVKGALIICELRPDRPW